MNKSNLIAFAQGQNIEDNRSIVVFVNRDGAGKLYSEKESFADSAATNGAKNVLFFKPGITATAEETKNLIEEAKKRLLHAEKKGRPNVTYSAGDKPENKPFHGNDRRPVW
jgi:hypothetical protein